MAVLRLAEASFVLVSARCYFSGDAWPPLSSSFAEVLTCHSEVMRHSLAPVCLVVPVADFVASAGVAADIGSFDLVPASFSSAIAAVARDGEACDALEGTRAMVAFRLVTASVAGAFHHDRDIREDCAAAIADNEWAVVEAGEDVVVAAAVAEEALEGP